MNMTLLSQLIFERDNLPLEDYERRIELNRKIQRLIRKYS